MVLFTPEIIAKYKSANSKLGEYNYFTKHTIDPKILGSLTRFSCNGNIGEGYLNESKNKVLSDKNYDLAAIFISQPGTTEAKQSKKTLAGFVIVQKGECAKMPDTYSINVICSNKNRGKILMGLTLYAIKSNPKCKDNRCILEVAGGYMNVGALCMYSKFGFVQDLSLYGYDCFSDVNF